MMSKFAVVCASGGNPNVSGSVETSWKINIAAPASCVTRKIVRSHFRRASPHNAIIASTWKYTKPAPHTTPTNVSTSADQGDGKMAKLVLYPSEAKSPVKKIPE